MREFNKPQPGQFYKHFKSNLYQVITLATHSETGEEMVVYQALYNDFKIFVRPLSMFLSEVDREKYPEVKQKYRFERVTLNNDEVKEIQPLNEIKETISDLEESGEVSNAVNSLEINHEVNVVKEKVVEEEGEINPILLKFLDAKSYEDKLDILLSNKKHLTDKMLSEMAISIDCVIKEGDLEERIANLSYCLQTYVRFENKRFR